MRNTIKLDIFSKPKDFNSYTKLCLQEVIDMGDPPSEVTVVPNANWSEATTATIKIGDTIIATIIYFAATSILIERAINSLRKKLKGDK